MGGREVDDYFPTIMVEVTTDLVIARGPCLVYGFGVTGSGGAGSVTLRQGTSDKGQAMRTLGAVDTESRVSDFPDPIYCPSGAFLDVAANTVASVQYAPAPQKPIG